MIRWFFLLTALLAAAVAMARAPLAPAPDDATVQGEGLPATLADYGFFADAANQVPSARVTPYRLNTPLWSDGAEKLRFLYLPAGVQAKARGEGLLDLPVGAALIKTFAFRQDGRRRLIETRVLLHRKDGWLALPYLWNADQTEATLALAGAKVPVTTPSGQAISYRVPNKNQCKECHGLDGVVTPIGPKARNLSRTWLAAQVTARRLDQVPLGADIVPLWEARDSVPVATAARGYLDANCAHCHQPGGAASNSGLDLRWEQSDPHSRGVMKRPVAAGRGAGDLLFDVLPGHPEQSILAHRMASTEGGVAMPELGKVTVDKDGVALIEKWISGL